MKTFIKEKIRLASDFSIMFNIREHSNIWKIRPEGKCIFQPIIHFKAIDNFEHANTQEILFPRVFSEESFRGQISVTQDVDGKTSAQNCM